jgi:hypothetical protein
MHVMRVRIRPLIAPPSAGRLDAIVDLPVPDHVGHPRVGDDLPRQHLTVHTVGDVMSNIERVAIIMVALPLLMSRVAHDPIRVTVA